MAIMAEWICMSACGVRGCLGIYVAFGAEGIHSRGVGQLVGSVYAVLDDLEEGFAAAYWLPSVAVSWRGKTD